MARAGRKRKQKIDPDARQPGESYFAWNSRLARERAERRDREQPLVPVEAEQHGDYRPGFVMHVETATTAHTKVNRGGSPVERWKASGKLTETQQVAIATCQRLWDILGLKTPLTANYGQRIGGRTVYEHMAVQEIDARRDLHRVIDYFPGPLQAYWGIFENVCRHDIPAGIAGASLAYGSRSAEVRAHQIVCFVADVIAMKEGL